MGKKKQEKMFDAKAALKKQTIRSDSDLENSVHLFMGQFSGDWKKLSKAAETVKKWGFDGIGAVTWGNTGFDVDKALDPKTGIDYTKAYIKTLDKQGLGISTLGDHLDSQAISAALINEELVNILSDRVVGGFDRKSLPYLPGAHEGVRLRAALKVMDTARAVERIRDVALKLYGKEKQEAKFNPTVVSGFTGSPIWHHNAGFPPISPANIEQGYQEVAYRMARILDVFRNTGNRFALETHPGEIAYDTVTAQRIFKTINRKEFGFNGDSSHSVGRGWDYIKYLDAIVALQVDVPESTDSELGALFASHLKGADEGTTGLGSAYRSDLLFGDARLGWDFKSLGRGRRDDGAVIYKLGDVGFKGALEIEWEDAQLKKAIGAMASALFTKGILSGNEGMVMRALKLYENPKNYKAAQFDAGFKKK